MTTTNPLDNLAHTFYCMSTYSVTTVLRWYEARCAIGGSASQWAALAFYLHTASRLCAPHNVARLVDRARDCEMRAVRIRALG